MPKGSVTEKLYSQPLCSIYCMYILEDVVSNGLQQVRLWMEGHFQDSSPAAAVCHSIICHPGLLLDLSMSMTNRDVWPAQFDLMLEYLPVCLSFLSLPPLIFVSPKLYIVNPLHTISEQHKQAPSYRRMIAFLLYCSWMLLDACRAEMAHFLLCGTCTVMHRRCGNTCRYAHSKDLEPGV